MTSYELLLRYLPCTSPHRERPFQLPKEYIRLREDHVNFFLIESAAVSALRHWRAELTNDSETKISIAVAMTAVGVEVAAVWICGTYCKDKQGETENELNNSQRIFHGTLRR
jgi:hypothetical protein